MSSHCTRRTLLTAAGLALSSQALAHPWVDFLHGQDLVGRVQAILERELGLPEAAQGLVPAFVRKLQSRDLSNEQPETFARWAHGGKRTQSELEAYVVEEFIISSNYFAVVAGEETSWRLLAPL